MGKVCIPCSPGDRFQLLSSKMLLNTLAAQFELLRKQQRLEGKIVFSSGKEGDFDIWTLELTTGRISQLTSGKDWNDYPRWSPDGATIAFVSNRSGNTELWMMNEDGSSQKQITKTDRYHGELCWSADGSSIFCTGNYENSSKIDIYEIPVAHPQKPKLIVADHGRDAGPDCSPDGTVIVFSSTKTGHECIWEFDLANRLYNQITAGPGRDYAPAYSPDGEFIAYVHEESARFSGGRYIAADIHIVRRNGNEVRRISVHSGADRYLSWSPDGKYVVCCSRSWQEDADRLCIVEVATAEVIDLVYDRAAIEEEIGAVRSERPVLRGKIANLLTFGYASRLAEQAYPKSYFGTERYPHWKR